MSGLTAGERIAAVLAEHDWFTPRGYAWPYCHCGVKFQDVEDAAVAHVAEQIDAALEPVLAQAWDEGVKAAFMGAITRQNAEDVKRANPYRQETPDA